MSDRPPSEVERELQAKHSRLRRLELGLVVAAIVLNVAIGLVVLSSQRILRDATGPDAADRQEQLIRGLLVRIDCDRRDTLQQVIDGLADQGLLEPGSVQVVLDDCRVTPSTSTTEAPE